MPVQRERTETDTERGLVISCTSGSSPLPDRGGDPRDESGGGEGVGMVLLGLRRVYTPGILCSGGGLGLTLVMAAEEKISPGCIRQLH